MGRARDRLEEARGLDRVGDLFESGSNGSVRCLACAHECTISEGGHGVCAVRTVRDGVLRVPRGYVSSLACDPIEKKPFYHFLPGEDALSFGMLGCNFHCPFCQNWQISQAFRDPEALAETRALEPQAAVAMARRLGARIVASTYNEPLITSEWGVEIFREARQAGMRTCYVSNGFASPRVLEYLDPWLDAMNVDLKCFSEAGYRTLGGRLGPVLDTIRALRERSKWVEVITLIVPGFNDGDDEIREIAEFLAGVDPDIPWHVSAYHAAYRMTGGPSRTPRERIADAVAIGHAAGIRYVYAGNISGSSAWSDTACHRCGTILVRRRGFAAASEIPAGTGSCPACDCAVPGVWA